MRTFQYLAAIITAVTLITANPVGNFDKQGRAVWQENQVCVKLETNIIDLDYGKTATKTGIRTLDNIFAVHKIERIQQRFKVDPAKSSPELPDLSRIYTLVIDKETDIQKMLIELENDANVEYAERIPVYYYDAVPSDSMYSYLTHLPQIQAEEAWDVHKGENGTEEVIIGVADSGIDWRHPDLAPNIYNNLGEDLDGDGYTLIYVDGEWIFDPDDENGIDDDGNGYVDDFIGWNVYADENGTQNNDPSDPSSHGTHVSGLAAGVTDNITGIASISWNVKVMATSHGYAGGGPYIRNGYQGIIYLAENGADIINNSWGGMVYTQAAGEVIEYARGLGAIIVASAGNGGGDSYHYPSDYPGVISVAAVDPWDYLTSYSNFGLGVDICAPGGDQAPGLLSTYPGNNYGYSSGTSMSGPVAAGALALLKSYYPDWSNDELIYHFLATADDISATNPIYSNLIGHGRVNAYRSLTEIDPQLTGGMRLSIHEIVSSRPDLLETELLPGDTVSLGFVIRNYAMYVEDPNVTFTLTSDNPHLNISPATCIDTIFADELSYIDNQFQIVVAPEATADFSDLTLHISPSEAEVSYGENLTFALTIKTVDVAESVLKTEIIFGEDGVEYLTLINSGIEDIHYQVAALDPFPNESTWHLDTANAFAGDSWYVGTGYFMEYPRYSAQIFTLPEVDLSGTSDPRLTFMTYYDIETPSESPPYDGWDGANVWISTDGGFNFTPIRPVFPEYECESIYAFEMYFEGDSIPGWAGASGGWVPAQFDLGQYLSEQVVIRIVMASDPASQDVGIFIDDIRIEDSENILYENNGKEDFKIKLTASSFFEEEPEWLTITEPTGTVAANSTADIPVSISTTDLTLGGYLANIKIVSDDLIPIADLHCNLSVKSPQLDTGLRSWSLPDLNYRVAREEPLSVIIDNYGIESAEAFLLTANLVHSAGEVWSDTILVDSLEPGQFTEFTFDPWYVDREGDLQLNIGISGLENDYNQFNNTISEDLEIMTLVDRFWNMIKPVWDLDGWGLTEMSGYQDGESMHCNAGTTPYQPNMDNALTYLPGVNIGALESFMIKYYTLIQLEQDADFGTFEISFDKQNWTVLNTHTGSDIAWRRNEIDLTEYCGTDQDSLWFRFHFTSDSQNQMMGYYIDQVEFLIPEVLASEKEVMLPQQITLLPNYPNPFNPVTSIRYSLPEAAQVEIHIHDITGRRIATLSETYQQAGFHSIRWNGRDELNRQVSSGVYFCRLQAGNYSQSIKMLLMK